MNFLSYLTEAKLTTKDLDKPISGYPNRGFILINKLKNKDPFEMMDGSTKQLSIDADDQVKLEDMAVHGSFADFNKTIKLKDVDDNVVRLSQIKKTAEFGSSSGIGGGSALATTSEASVAILSAIFLNKKFNDGISMFNYLIEHDLNKELEVHKSRIVMNAPLNEIVDHLLGDLKGFKGYCNMAWAINKELNLPNNIIFHHDSKIVKKIIKHATNLLKLNGFGSIRKDKWNPADIWAITPDSSTLDQFLKTETLAEANQALLDGVSKKQIDLIGISLKKSGKTGLPSIKWVNLKEEDFNLNITQINPQFFGVKIPITKSVILIDSDPPIEVDLRSFRQTIGDLVNAEILGKSGGRHGKVGFSAMSKFLSNVNDKFNSVKRYKKNEILTSDNKIQDSFINDMFKLIQKLQDKPNVDVSKINNIKTPDDLKKLVDKMLTEKNDSSHPVVVASILSSKIQAMQFAVYSTDEFFQLLYMYASSSIKDISSVFLKIG